jgi:hypothetical protein
MRPIQHPGQSLFAPAGGATLEFLTIGRTGDNVARIGLEIGAAM